MSRLVVNRDGGKSDEYATHLVMQRAFTGEVVEGLLVTQDSPSASMNVRVQPGTIRIPSGSAPSNFWYECILDTAMPGEQVPIPASQSNPFWVYIVAYVDKSVTPDKTTVTNNSNDMFKFKAVAGTPASSPNRPTTAQITASSGSGGIGSTNPYAVISEVYVDASATQIVDAKITDIRKMLSPIRSGYDVLRIFTLPADSNSVSLKNLPLRENLRVIAHVIPSGNVNHQIAFNGDGSNSYSETYHFNGGVSTQSPSTSQLNVEAANGTYYEYIVIDITNRASLEKLGKLTATITQVGAGAAIQDFISKFKWANTSDQISRIDFNNTGTGKFAAGSRFTVLGSNF